MEHPRNGLAVAGISPAQLLDQALAVVRAAADLAREMRSTGVGELSTKSTDTDVVTAADRAVERQVVAAIRAARPGDACRGHRQANPRPFSAARRLLL